MQYPRHSSKSSRPNCIGSNRARHSARRAQLPPSSARPRGARGNNSTVLGYLGHGHVVASLDLLDLLGTGYSHAITRPPCRSVLVAAALTICLLLCGGKCPLLFKLRTSCRMGGAIGGAALCSCAHVLTSFRVGWFATVCDGSLCGYSLPPFAMSRQQVFSKIFSEPDKTAGKRA